MRLRRKQSPLAFTLDVLSDSERANVAALKRLLGVALLEFAPDLYRLSLDPVSDFLRYMPPEFDSAAVSLLASLDARPKAGWTLSEVSLDPVQEEDRKAFVRLAYYSNEATAWFAEPYTPLFESIDAGENASLHVRSREEALRLKQVLGQAREEMPLQLIRALDEYLTTGT